MTDLINHPPHYKARGIRCDHCGKGIECRNVNRYFTGNLSAAIKYVWRCDFKGAEIQDLEKAVNYLNDEIAWRNRQRVLKGNPDGLKINARWEASTLRDDRTPSLPTPSQDGECG